MAENGRLLLRTIGTRVEVDPEDVEELTWTTAHATYSQRTVSADALVETCNALLALRGLAAPAVHRLPRRAPGPAGLQGSRPVPELRRSTHGRARAHLVDNVLPRVPVRQWVLSLPFDLRLRLAFDHELCRKVHAVFARALTGDEVDGSER